VGGGVSGDKGGKGGEGIVWKQASAVRESPYHFINQGEEGEGGREGEHMQTSVSSE
jgi:hypothetical protein